MIHKIIFIVLICIPFFYVRAQQDLDVLLIARNTGSKVLANNDTIRVFGFAENLGSQPGVPGPTIVANEGDSVHIDVWNVSQGAPHTIHLHGLDVDQQNDGVPHLSFDIPHMEHGYYHFKAPHAGTYLYHCHVASTIHVQAGMYGLIIIKPTDGSNTTWNGGYEFTEDHSYFLSEIDTNWHVDSVLMHDHDTTFGIHYVEIPTFNPQFFLINGFSDQQLIDEGESFNSSVDQVDYSRFTNIGYSGTRIIFPSGLNAQIIDSDGRPLPSSEISDTLYVYPGERYGVLTEPSFEFEDEISFEYFDLNTFTIRNTQIIPVSVNGFLGNSEIPLLETSIKIAPNPFKSNTQVKINLEESHSIELKVFDIQGRLMFSEQDKLYKEGKHVFKFGDEFPSNQSYFIQLKIDSTILPAKQIVKL